MDITHAMRPVKVEAGKTVDPQWYAALPLHLRNPRAVLLKNQELLLIYDSGADKAKIVALVDYRGTGLNIVRTASRLVETMYLLAMIERGEWRLVEGGL